MKNIFEFRRFGRVLRYSWATQPTLPYIVLVAAIPLMYIYLLRAAAAEYASIFSDEPFLMFNTYFLGCSWLYAGLSFGEFSRFDSASRFLLLPGSVLEKWLAKVLLVYIAFPFIVWGTFNLAYQGLGFLSERLVAFRFLAIDWSSKEMEATLFFFSLTLPAAFASGIVWKRFGFLKGVIFIFILVVLLYFIVADGLNRYSYTVPTAILFRELTLPFFDLECSGRTCFYIQLFWGLAAYLPSLLLLGSTYVFMKEKEV